MITFLKLSIALLLGLSTIGLPDAATAAEDGVPAEAAASPDAGTKPAEKKVVVKRKKGRKKGGTKERAAGPAEYTPGDKLTLKQVQEILKGNRDLSGKNMSGLQLVGVNLSRCNLKGADLTHANLERADLEEATLERADLAGANLKRANLRMAGMIGANVENAILDGAVWKDGRVCAAGSVGQCREFGGR